MFECFIDENIATKESGAVASKDFKTENEIYILYCCEHYWLKLL